MKHPILKEQWQLWQTLHIKADMIETDLVARIGYICQKLCENFGVTYLTWFFSDAPDGSVGQLRGHFDSEGIQVFVDYEGHRNFQSDIPLKKGGTVSLDVFPCRWLCEEFEDELKTSIEDMKFAEAVEAAKLSKLNEKQKELAIHAKAKLTPEEWKAIKKIL